MDFDILVERWVVWCLNGGYASLREFSGLEATEYNWEGECSNKKGSASLSDDEAVRKLHSSFLDGLSMQQQEVLIVHYRLLPWIPPMRTASHKAKFCGCLESTYRSRLNRAKKAFKKISMTHINK